MRQEKLFGAHEIQRFNRDADEAIAWINEKDVILSSDEYGRDLASIQALIRKHEGVERDLAALHDKVNTLGAEADRLCGIHGDHADQIRSKHEEIVENWEGLVEKAKVSYEYLCLNHLCECSCFKTFQFYSPANRNWTTATHSTDSCQSTVIWSTG